MRAWIEDVRGAHGDCLRAALDECGGSMAQAAKTLGLDPKIVQRMARGQMPLRPEVIAAEGRAVEIAFHRARLRQLEAEQREAAHADLTNSTLLVNAKAGELAAALQKALADGKVDANEATADLLPILLRLARSVEGGIAAARKLGAKEVLP